MERLEEIRERLNKATRGPWDMHRYSVEDWNGNQVCGDFTHEEDKAFIAHSIDDIKYLLEQFTTLQEENADLRNKESVCLCCDCAKTNATLAKALDVAKKDIPHNCSTCQNWQKDLYHTRICHDCWYEGNRWKWHGEEIRARSAINSKEASDGES